MSPRLFHWSFALLGNHSSLIGLLDDIEIVEADYACLSETGKLKDWLKIRAGGADSCRSASHWTVIRNHWQYNQRQAQHEGENRVLLHSREVENCG